MTRPTIILKSVGIIIEEKEAKCDRLQAVNADLLAALVNTLQAYLDQCAMEPDQPTCDQARAAIAKARGQ